MPAAGLTALSAALRTSVIPLRYPFRGSGHPVEVVSGALMRPRPQVPSRPPAEPCSPSPPGVHGPSA